ncbi:MAG TPA: aminotransferase class V-fold PLP-dependent enzyme, partial [Clostridia bacterium]|nr:aminotransferase class V-fold PLP-dependent enzyme [Clostridia bacterium]
KTSILPFTVRGYAPEEIGRLLDREGIAVRTGHHCAQPLVQKFGLESVVRASLALYNTKEEIDRMVSVLGRLTGGQY